MDKKKVKELIQEVIINNVDSLEFGNDKHNAPLRKANSLFSRLTTSCELHKDIYTF